MPNLRSAARDLLNAASIVRNLARPAVEAFAERLDPNGPGIERPHDHKAYDAIAERIRYALEQGQPLSRAQLTDAAWCLWTTVPALAENTAVLEAYLQVLAKSELVRPLRTLASSYLMYFRPGLPNLELVAETLAQHASRIGAPWDHAHETLKLFDPRQVASAVSQAAIAEGMRPAEVLDGAGLGPIPEDAGILLEAHGAGLSALAADANIDPVARLSLLRKWATRSDDTLFAPELSSLATEALLGPFHETLPDTTTRDCYSNFIVDLFGDPRTVPEWAGHNPEAEHVARRWLTEQSLRLYLDSVATLKPPADWEYRRTFWQSLYRAGLIDEAWVVFDEAGVAAARQLVGNSVSVGGFAPGADLEPGDAALMLKVGWLLVIDWSKGGPCCIWDTRREMGAPKLFQPWYPPVRFRKPTRGPDTIESHAAQGVFWHTDLRNYDWQDQISAYLREVHGVQLQDSAYRM